VSVTILLTLKGRPRHTLRWFAHAERTRLPFPVLVADGGEDPEIERLLSDPASFPNVNYRYLRYHDRELKDFWFKLADASARIETPYAMMSDNDDFLLPSAIQAAVDFLDQHPDYVAAGGPQVSFSLEPLAGRDDDGVAGTIRSFGLQASADCFGEDHGLARLAAFWRHRTTFYYDVIRTPAFQAGYADTKALDFRHFDVWENFLYASLLLKGKVKRLAAPGYLRQLGTSQAHAAGKGWLQNLFHHGWMADFEKMLTHLHAVAGPEGEALDALMRDGMVGAIRLGAAATPPPASRLGRLTPLVALNRWRRRRALLAGLRDAGASAVSLDVLAGALDQVAATLSSPELRRLVDGTAP
jgi:glycosyltransferase domain-containing protein